MLEKFKNLFAGNDRHRTKNPRKLELAAAALMIELCKADFNRDPREQQAMIGAIRNTFELDDVALAEIIDEAESANASSTSLYEFTSIVNERCNEEEKYLLVCGLWRVAFADGNIDKYESHLISKIAELIYLPHALYIKAKLEIAARKGA